MAKVRVRHFQGPWPQAYPRIQLYLLEMLAGRPDPSAIHLRLAKALATPEEMRRDVPALRDALVHRLGPGRVHCDAVDGAQSHEIRLECARVATVEALGDPPASSRT